MSPYAGPLSTNTGVTADTLFKFFKDPRNGECTIMLGVPNDWAGWKDARIELLKKYATVISPWNVGRFGTPEGARAHYKRYFPVDTKFCEANSLDYYPVVFPGFSWENLKKNGKLDHIKRRKGRFFWSQVEEVRKYGLNMLYVAMFDEIDEGTAIFKCTNNPPVGRFCTYEGLPSDFYLRLTGLAGRYVSGEDVSFPDVKAQPVSYRPMALKQYESRRPVRMPNQ